MDDAARAVSSQAQKEPDVCWGKKNSKKMEVKRVLADYCYDLVARQGLHDSVSSKPNPSDKSPQIMWGKVFLV